MTLQERLELVALARRYADGLERLSAAGVPGVSNSTSLIVSIELFRQLARIMEGAECLDETAR